MDIKSIKEKYDLEQVRSKRSSLEQEMSVAHNDPSKDMSALSQDLHYYSELFRLIEELLHYVSNCEQAQEMSKTESDPDLLEMAQLETNELSAKIEELDKQITAMKIEREFSSPQDLKSVILEIRAGAGGEEAALFAADLFRMYKNYADTKGWATEIIDSSTTDAGGYKEILANIKGRNVYRDLKYESGVHRVQRVPVTESSGRIHTSTASVAIMPEAQDVDVSIKPEELRIDVMRASGAGGQKVNKTDSAVRITHLPTGIVVSCQETKFQSQNKEKAMTLLRSRLYDRRLEEAQAERSDMRSSQIGSSMRAEKIRTFNYPQNRITDHRIKQSWYNIEEVLAGVLGEIIEAVRQGVLEQELAKFERNKARDEKSEQEKE